MHSFHPPTLPLRTIALTEVILNPISFLGHGIFLQVWIIFVRERGVRCSLHFFVVLFKQRLVNLHGRRFQGQTGNKIL